MVLIESNIRSGNDEPPLQCATSGFHGDRSEYMPSVDETTTGLLTDNHINEQAQPRRNGKRSPTGHRKSTGKSFLSHGSQKLLMGVAALFIYTVFLVFLNASYTSKGSDKQEQGSSTSLSAHVARSRDNVMFDDSAGAAQVDSKIYTDIEQQPRTTGIDSAVKTSDQDEQNTVKDISDFSASKASFLLREGESNTPLKILILIPTTANSFEDRQTVRDTWAKPHNSSDAQAAFSERPAGIGGKQCHTRVIFAVGRNRDYDSRLILEQGSHRDMILVDVEDGWPNVSLKYVTALGQALQLEDSNFDYLMRVDLDTYLDQHLLCEWLIEVAPRKKLWAGSIMIGSEVYRPGHKGMERFAVPEEMYAPTMYPGYHSGFAQIMSRDVVEDVVHAAAIGTFSTPLPDNNKSAQQDDVRNDTALTQGPRHIIPPPLPNVDDAYLGILAEASGIVPVNINRVQVVNNNKLVGTYGCRGLPKRRVFAMTTYGKSAEQIAEAMTKEGCPLGWYALTIAETCQTLSNKRLAKPDQSRNQWISPWKALGSKVSSNGKDIPKSEVTLSKGLLRGRKLSFLGNDKERKRRLDQRVESETKEPLSLVVENLDSPKMTLFNGKPAIWMYWEDLDLAGEKPKLPIVGVLVDTVRILNRDHFEVLVVNSSTIRTYLGDAVHPAFEYLSPMHRADHFRAEILYRHGGMYMDVDTLVLKSLKPLFDKLYSEPHGYDALGYRDSLYKDILPDGDNFGYGVQGPMRKGNPISQRYVTLQRALLDTLQPQLERHQADPKAHAYPISWSELSVRGQLIPWLHNASESGAVNYLVYTDARKTWLKYPSLNDPASSLNSQPIDEGVELLMLHGSMLQDFKDMTRWELLHSDTVLSALLPVDELLDLYFCAS